MSQHTATKHLAYARKFATLLDSQFKVFGIPVGLDPVLGLIPGFGDILAILFSMYLLWIGIQMNLSGDKLLMMLFNVIVDTTIGAIPLVGDIADFFFHSNLRNLEILESHLKENSAVIDGEVIP